MCRRYGISLKPYLFKTQLTEAEASFRALKSELSIRPLFHQKEPRVKAHGMVGFSGLCPVGDVEAVPVPRHAEKGNRSTVVTRCVEALHSLMEASPVSGHPSRYSGDTCRSSGAGPRADGRRGPSRYVRIFRHFSAGPDTPGSANLFAE